MAIFLRQSHLVKPPRWGSFADVMYAIKVNSEKIYGIDPDNDVLVMPLFWGLPLLDYSGYNNHGTNHGTTFKDGSLSFDGGDDYVDNSNILITGINAYSISVWAKSDGTPNIINCLAGSASGSEHEFYVSHEQASDKWLYAWRYGIGTQRAIRSDSVVIENQRYHVVATNNGSNQYLYVDGIQQSITASVNGFSHPNFSSDIGTFWSSTAYVFDGFIDEVRIAKAALIANQVSLFYDRPWDLYRPISRPVWSIPTGAYTITAVEGSYSITGQTVNLLRDSIVSSEAGSIALSGLSTNLLKGFVLGAGAGSITLTGFSTDLLKGSLIGAEAGSIVLTGQDVTLSYSGGAYILTAGSGSITLTGTQVDLLRAGRLPSGAGSIILTGTNVDLLRGFLLGAEVGSYTLTGTAATLLRAAKLGVDSGTYDLVGFNVGLNYSEEEWKKIILRGLDVLSGQLVNITGQYKEV